MSRHPDDCLGKQTARIPARSNANSCEISAAHINVSRGLLKISEYVSLAQFVRGETDFVGATSGKRV